MEISQRLERERARDDEEILRRLDYSTKLRREKLVAVLGDFVLGFADGFCGSGFWQSGFRRWVFGVVFGGGCLRVDFIFCLGCYCFLQFFEFQIRLHPNKGVNFSFFFYILFSLNFKNRRYI